MDLFLYCVEVPVHDSGHSKSNIYRTMFGDHEPIKVDHTVTTCVALALELITTCKASGTVHGYILRGHTNLYQ